VPNAPYAARVVSWHAWRMFLRRKSKMVRGVGYSYWHLCRTVRTERGPRQQVVASLGKLDERELAALRGGWDDLPALLRGEAPAPRHRTPPLPGFESVGPDDSAPQWEQADLAGLRVERSRDFGESYLALSLWHRLGLDRLLAELLPEGRESVAWSHIAALLTTARFCAQPSELGVAEQWFDSTALDDLLGLDSTQINDDRLYRGLDRLAEHKDKLCAHLMERYRQWFGVRFEFLLYDVTSTYFEGEAAGNPQAQRGYSRDQRSGHKQVCIGLVCTPEGLPLSFEVFAGNRADVTTVEDIVRVMETKYGQAERVWVMDRGMVSEANLAFLRERKARYLVGTPKSWLRAHEQTLLGQSDWREAQHGLEVRLVEHPGGEPGERYVLCRSGARAEKERAMLQRQSERLTEELRKVDAWLTRSPQQDRETVGRRIGRHLGKYPAAAAIVVAEVLSDAQGRAAGLRVFSRLEAGQKAHRQKGAYLLRTNCDETDPALLWRWYIQLTQAEAAFRTAKSDLGLRPVFHHREDRVQAHILVCFLSLALWRTLEQWMQSRGLGSCARQLVKEMAGVKSVDVIVPVRRAGLRTQLRLRVVTTAEPALAQVLGHLGLRLPQGSRLIGDVVPKIGT
jgi:transposase